MRWLPWILALVGIAQFSVFALVKPEGYVSLDMAYLVMALFILGAALSWTCAWGCCGWGGGGCGCDHCEGCAGDDCCGDCRCCGDGHGHGHGDEPGHEGHSH